MKTDKNFILLEVNQMLCLLIHTLLDNEADVRSSEVRTTVTPLRNAKTTVITVLIIKSFGGSVMTCVKSAFWC